MEYMEKTIKQMQKKIKRKFIKLMWLFSQLVGRKGSRVQGYKGSSVCFLMILSKPSFFGNVFVAL
jgi:hypothetical protein